MDGFAFADLSSRQEELAAHREELERQKKQTSKKKGSVSNSQREQLEKEEILKLRAAVLKKVRQAVGVQLGWRVGSWASGRAVGGQLGWWVGSCVQVCIRRAGTTGTGGWNSQHGVGKVGT